MIKYFLAAIMLTLTFCNPSTPNQETVHKYRSEFHFSPAKNWMNDPNGMFYQDGVYHLYFQHNPYGEKWGHMSWGHATSTDLIHWTEHDIAILEEDGIMIFSGSAVVDRDNTSGFGDGTTPPIVAIYTGHIDGKNQAQYIAYSLDGGYTFTKYEENPVIDLGMKDFRDPKVFWHKDTQKWVMIVSKPLDHVLQFYGSPDLKNWDLLSEFGPKGAFNGGWECPDMFELPVDGDPTNTRWVVEIDLGENGNNPGSSGQYFIGDFDGITFTLDENAQDYPVWVDQGHDFYAGVSWFNWDETMPKQWIAWASNLSYAGDIPTEGWRSTMSLPRNMELKTVGNKLRLFQTPVSSYKELRNEHYAQNGAIEGTEVLPESAQKLVQTGKFELGLVIPENETGNFSFKVEEQFGGFLSVRVDQEKQIIEVSRKETDSTFTARVFEMPQIFQYDDGVKIESLTLIYDKSMAELFVNNGLYTFTNQMFVDNASLILSLEAENEPVEIQSLDVWSLEGALSSTASSN